MAVQYLASRGTARLWCYGVAGSAFDPTPVVPPPTLQPVFRRAHANPCYAPEFDVHVMRVAPSGSGSGRVLVYRHER